MLYSTFDFLPGANLHQPDREQLLLYSTFAFIPGAQMPQLEREQLKAVLYL